MAGQDLGIRASQYSPGQGWEQLWIMASPLRKFSEMQILELTSPPESEAEGGGLEIQV